MSFSMTVKDEISKLKTDSAEQISELSGVVCNFDYNNYITIHSENSSIARKIFTLFKNIYDIHPKIETQKGFNYTKKLIYTLSVKSTDNILKTLGLKENKVENFIIADDSLRRAFLRGIFMVCGSINDPKKSRYHLEFNFDKKNIAHLVNDLLNNYNLNSKIIHRNKYMVYIKEAEKIGDFLRMIGAYNAVLYYEDIRIYRDHKNMTNRLNNCEQANVDRTIESANNQVNDINLIKEKEAFDLLDEKEKLAATYRLKYSDVSLTELAEIISLETDDKITKSGLYHRFNKIKKLAERLKK